MHELDLLVWSLATPLAMGMVEVLKQAGLPRRWSGLAALGCGTAAGGLVGLAGVGDGSLGMALLSGAVGGLSAAGVWSGSRATLAFSRDADYPPAGHSAPGSGDSRAKGER